jgi:hypothetical protein
MFALYDLQPRPSANESLGKEGMKVQICGFQCTLKFMNLCSKKRLTAAANIFPLLTVCLGYDVLPDFFQKKKDVCSFMFRDSLFKILNILAWVNE